MDPILATRATYPLRKALIPRPKTVYAAHPRSVEWVFGCAGKAELALDGARYEVSTGDLAIVPPRCPHLERIRNPSHGYHLLWFCVFPDQSQVGIYSSLYNSGRRFDLQLVRGTRVKQRADVCRLFTRSAEEALNRGIAWDGQLHALRVNRVVAVSGLNAERNIRFFSLLIWRSNEGRTKRVRRWLMMSRTIICRSSMKIAFCCKHQQQTAHRTTSSETIYEVRRWPPLFMLTDGLYC